MTSFRTVSPPTIPLYITRHSAYTIHMDTVANILEVKHLNAYQTSAASELSGGRKQNRRQILFDVSFCLKEGEILGLAGRSGSGKTTLAKTILHINKDYDGTIEHFSERPQMIFQDPVSALNPARKIAWILEEPLKIAGGLSKDERKQRVREMLAHVGLAAQDTALVVQDAALVAKDATLESILTRYPGQLSGGQRQRLMIAAALMNQPRLLIADEPVSALDAKVEEQILELLKSLHKQMGLSIILISHDMRVLKKMCTRLLIMDQGHLSDGDMELGLL